MQSFPTESRCLRCNAMPTLVKLFLACLICIAVIAGLVLLAQRLF